MSPRPVERPDPAALRRFSRTAEIATTDVIRTYSTSFGLATRLLGTRHRQHVRNIYAMVRIADEIVDGVAAEAGLDASAQAAALDSYIAETHRSMRTGYSSDLILHAFARTARECAIGEDLTGPFFDSMRADISRDAGFTAYDADAHAAYVYGSAEVVGLMCLQVFLRDADRTPEEREILHRGARRLGAAFQNVNFLRDLADDTDRLQRGYLGGTERLTDADRDAWVATVERQLADARAAIPLLPKDARAAVRSALALFAALTRRVAKTPAAELYRRRVRVPDPVKALLAARAVATTAWERDR
ncbi:MULTISPECIES: phytoene/squalene synthase family protein [Microbacterium]|uniref:Squalene/phytoene synthase family protein n=1 Tax=Microbacterium sufflavum TaxID=2851649 RepID=A0ABY4IA18_9MICO|nr:MULTISPECIES: squalene/phytoene synthase family protein [Microbacterium]MPS75368.1 phytoene synthase [Microbacterium sp.]UPL09602.1 squalene/phytoene synthase family protein [Microbacterium sufflavum]